MTTTQSSLTICVLERFLPCYKVNFLICVNVQHDNIDYLRSARYSRHFTALSYSAIYNDRYFQKTRAQLIYSLFDKLPSIIRHVVTLAVISTHEIKCQSSFILAFHWTRAYHMKVKKFDCPLTKAVEFYLPVDDKSFK